MTDPATAYKIATIAYGAWEGYNERRRAERMLDLLEGIDKKLDQVLDNQLTIISELRRLRVYIDEAFEKDSIADLREEVESRRRSLNIISRLIPLRPEEALARLKEIEEPTRRLSMRLMGKGFASFIISIPAVLVHLAALDSLRELEQDETVTDVLELSFLEEWENIFQSWLADTNQRGITYPGNLLKKKARDLETKIDKFPRKHFYGWRSTGKYKDDGSQTCRIARKQVAIIEGDKSIGFQDYIADTKEKRLDSCRDNPRDPLGRDKMAHDIDTELLGILGIEDGRARSEDGELENEVDEYELGNLIAFGTDKKKKRPANHKQTKKLKAIHKQWRKTITDQSKFAQLVKLALTIRNDYKKRRDELRATIGA